MICPNCRREIPDGELFCPLCGAGQAPAQNQNPMGMPYDEHTGEFQRSAPAYQQPRPVYQQTSPAYRQQALNTKYDQSQQMPADQTEGLCIAGMIVSLISLMMNLFGLVGAAGLVLSIAGIIRCSKNGTKGKAMAVIGIAVGGISVLFGILVDIYLVMMMM